MQFLLIYTLCGIVYLSLTPSVHRQIAMLARQAGLTINAYIKDTLEKRIKGLFSSDKWHLLCYKWLILSHDRLLFKL
jgi:hypothetical protein